MILYEGRVWLIRLWPVPVLFAPNVVAVEQLELFSQNA